MNPLWQSSVVVLAILTWLTVPPRSLAEAAQREAFRRHTTPKARVVLTNAGLPQTAVAAVAATTPPPDEPPPDANVTATVAKPAAAASAGNQDEQWWRKRMATAREKLKSDQQAVLELQTRINGIQRDVVNRDNPAQQAKLREDLQKALATLDTTKRQIDLDQKAILTIQDEARRADVPAGWVR